MTALPFTPDQLVATFCLDHSVQEYAKAFRGTLNAEGEVELAPPVRARIQASLLMSQLLIKTPVHETMPFFEKLASRYLPSVVDIETHTLSELKMREQPSSESMAFATVISRLVAVSSPMLVRYLKDHPRSQAFRAEVMTQLPNHLPEVPFRVPLQLDRPNTAESVQSRLLLMLETLCRKVDLVRLLLLHCHAAPLVLPPAEAVRTLKSIEKYSHASVSRADTLELSRGFGRVEEGVGDVLALLKRDQAAVFTDGQSHCRAAAQGGCIPYLSLLSCSKCRAVSYCSPEHQKADWKQHKAICFAPTW